MTRSTRTLYWISVIAILWIWLHAGKSIYFDVMPISHWVEYLDIQPTEDVVMAGTKIYFMSHTNVYRNSNLEFNDVLHCRDPISKGWRRFSEQNTSRAQSQPELDRFTPWPYSPIPAYETECYLESNIILHGEQGQHKTLRFDGLGKGHIIQVKE